MLLKIPFAVSRFQSLISHNIRSYNTYLTKHTCTNQRILFHSSLSFNRELFFNTASNLRICCVAFVELFIYRFHCINNYCSLNSDDISALKWINFIERTWISTYVFFSTFSYLDFFIRRELKYIGRAIDSASRVTYKWTNKDYAINYFFSGEKKLRF